MLPSLLSKGCTDGLPHWVQSEAEASYYHTHKLISTASCDAQTVQTDALFTGKLETRFKNHPKNRTSAGILVSRLKEDGGLPTKVSLPTGSQASPAFVMHASWAASLASCSYCIQSSHELLSIF